MAHTWKNGELITAGKLNSMERILPVTFTRTLDDSYAIYTSDLTIDEIIEQINNFMIPMLDLVIDETIPNYGNKHEDWRGTILTKTRTDKVVLATPPLMLQADNHLIVRISLIR